MLSNKIFQRAMRDDTSANDQKFKCEEHLKGRDYSEAENVMLWFYNVGSHQLQA